MKKLVLALCLLFAFFMFGCKKSDLNNDEIDALNALNECCIVYQEGDNENSVTKNITFALPSNLKVKCDIKISDENLISKEGFVVRGEEDKAVSVTFVVSLNDAKYEKTFNLTIIKLENSGDNGGSGNGDDGGNGSGGQETENGQLASADFTGLEKGATPIIDGWTLDVSNKGAYDTGWLSFRNNKESVETSIFSKQTSVSVNFIYYMNNIGTSGNKSSKIKFSALNENGDVVDEWLSDELNFLNEGEKSANTSYAKTLSANLIGEDIVKVKVEFVKDGGGNIGFSTITVSVNEQHE